MEGVLRAIIVEDSEQDAELISVQFELQGIPLESVRVDTAEGLREALRSARWDIVLSDYRMPGFSAFEALRIVNATGHDLPFILVSGAIGEEQAAKALRLGARDFVHKNNIARLVPSVRRELAEVKTRQERREAERHLLDTLEKLREERELRDRFVVALTHDLRTPLTAAKMNAQLLERYPDREHTRKEVLPKIISNLDRMDRMIKDLLDASRIEAGKPLPISPIHFDLQEACANVLEELRQIHGSRIRLDSTGPASGYWDPDALRRALENLVNNGMKYGAPDSTVVVSLQRGDAGVRLEVHNQGNPIDPKDQERLFLAFQRAKNVDQSGEKGWGIGLTLVRGITEAHKGRVKLRSTQEEGTTFTLELPWDSRPSPHSEPSTAQEAS